jgi:hypothetical protein
MLWRTELTLIAVTKCCTLNIDLSKVSKDQFKSKTRASDSMQYTTVDYKLLVRIEGARMVFAFECNGTEYAAVDAEY